MTNLKKHLPLFLFFISSLAGFWFLSSGVDPQYTSLEGKKNRLPTEPGDQLTSARSPGSVPQRLQIPASPSSVSGPADPVWKEKVEKALLTQGGGQLKSAQIHRVDSFNWKSGKIEIPVDSVIVKLEHVKGYRSSFRAIVDASNGKILQTWDQPVMDDFNHKHATGIRVDPRYHND